MSTYTPTPVELGDITLPADGEDVDASSVNVPIEAVADGVAFLAAGLGMKSKTFTSDGTWNSPANCGPIGFVEMWGGGGGGAGGGLAGTTNTDSACGGSGGAGAQRVFVPVPLTPSTAYAVDVGAGGSGGAVQTGGNDGSRSAFGTIAYAKGGGGGISTNDVPAGSGAARVVRGGSPVQVTAFYYQRVPMVNASDFVQTAFGAGGAATNAVTAAGNSHPGNLALTQADGIGGGSPGTHGSTVSTYLGGGAGGGGGAGPEGSGGAGGNGGNGNNAGVGGSGTAGSAASANTGAGGGGGGAGGQGTSAGTAGVGGAGGSGKVTIYYFGDAT